MEPRKEQWGLIVREASGEDIENLAHLMTEPGYPSSTEEMGRRFEDISADHSYAILVAEGDGKVLGMVALHGALYTIRKSTGEPDPVKPLTTC